MTLRESLETRIGEDLPASYLEYADRMYDAARLTLDAVEAEMMESPSPHRMFHCHLKDTLDALRAQLTVSPMPCCQVCDRERSACLCRSYTAGLTETKDAQPYIQELEEAAGAGLHEERRQRAVAGDPAVPSSPVPQWQPIETHVGPAMRVLVTNGRYVEIGECWPNEQGEYRTWCDDRGKKLRPEPTHFQPLPSPPAEPTP